MYVYAAFQMIIESNVCVLYQGNVKCMTYIDLQK